MTRPSELTATALQLGGLLPEGTRVDVFQQIFLVFLVLGTLIGIVVIAYMLYNAYKYRDDGSRDAAVDRPELGELPSGGGKGRKLFLSFTLSAIIVISLIGWTYMFVLYVEAGDSGVPTDVNTSQSVCGPATQNDSASVAEGDGPLPVTLCGFQFGWNYTYPNGHSSPILYVPEDRRVQLRVTSTDVMHNYGAPELRVKTDAMPGQYTTTWFNATETGDYHAQCYELCGTGHSFMTSKIEVMAPGEFESWYTGLNATAGAAEATAASDSEASS
jgi:cytochrome c oxidase subunit 2